LYAAGGACAVAGGTWYFGPTLQPVSNNPATAPTPAKAVILAKPVPIFFIFVAITNPQSPAAGIASSTWNVSRCLPKTFSLSLSSAR
jgi:hypothetical protein